MMWNSGWSAWEGRLEDGNKCRSLWHAIHTHNTRIQRKDNETLTLKRQLINDSYTSSRMNVLPTFECLIRSPSFCWDWTNHLLSLSLSLSLSHSESYSTLKKSSSKRLSSLFASLPNPKLLLKSLPKSMRSPKIMSFCWLSPWP